MPFFCMPSSSAAPTSPSMSSYMAGMLLKMNGSETTFVSGTDWPIGPRLN